MRGMHIHIQLNDLRARMSSTEHMLTQQTSQHQAVGILEKTAESVPLQLRQLIGANCGDGHCTVGPRASLGRIYS